MKGKVVSLMLFFFLVSIALTTAATVENLELLDANGEPVSIVGTDSKRVTLRFNIVSPDESIPILLDLSPFYQGDELAQLEERDAWIDRQTFGYESSIDVKDICEPLGVDAHTGYYCQIPNVVLKTSQTQLPVSINVGGEVLSQSLTFTVDTQPPSISSLQTEFCTNEGCYLPAGVPTDILLSASDNNPLVPEKIFFVLGQTRAFESCEANNCQLETFIASCSSGQEFAVSIRGSDAFGNAFRDASNTVFICDEKTPGEDTIPGIGSGFDIDLGTPELFGDFKNGDTITITARVTEDISGVNAYADLSALTGVQQSLDENGEVQRTPGSCAREDENTNVYVCTWPSVQIVEGTHEIDIIFEDNAGHVTFPEKKVVTVIPYDAEITTEELDIFQDIEAQPNSQRGYSRLAIQMATQNEVEYPLFATFTPKLKDANTDVEIVKTFVSDSDCTYTGQIPDTLVSEDEGIEEEDTIAASNFLRGVKVSDEFFTYDAARGENSIVMQLREETLNVALNEYKFVCMVKAVIKLDGVAINEPAEFNVTIPIILRDSAIDATGKTIGKAYYDKIKTKEERITGSFPTTVAKIRNVLNTMEGVCTTVDTLTVATSALSSAEAVATACGESCNPISTAIGKAGGKVSRVVDSVIGGDIGLGSAGDLGIDFLPGVEEDDNIFTAACKLATCSGEDRLFNLNSLYNGGSDQPNSGFVRITDPNEWFGDREWLAEGNSYAQNVGAGFKEDLLAGVGVPDAQGSLLSSINSMCIPGVIYHVDKYRQMNCEQLSCYKRAASLGLDVASCDQAQARSLCMATYGELAELSPTKAVEDVLDNFNAVIQNSVPAAAKNLISSAACKATKDAGYISKPAAVRLGLVLGCKIPKSVAQISYQISDSAQTNTVFNIPEGDACDFALCNEQDSNDCAGTPPPFLQNIVQNNPQLVPEAEVPNYLTIGSDQASLTAAERRFSDLASKDSPFSDAELKDLDRYSGILDRSKPTTNNNGEIDKYYTDIATQMARAAGVAKDLGLPLRTGKDGPFIDTGEYRRKTGPSLSELATLAGNAIQTAESRKNNIVDAKQREFFEHIAADDQTYSDPETGLLITHEITRNPNTNTIEYREIALREGDGTVVSNEIIETVEGSQKELRRIEKALDAEIESDKATGEYEVMLKEADDYASSTLSSNENGETILNDNLAQNTKKETTKSPEEKLLDLKREKDLRFQAALDIGINMGVQWAFQQGMLDALQWDDALGWTFVNDLSNVLNSDNRRATICDDLTSIGASDNYEANIVQCDNRNFCQPVLSFAGERIQNQDDEYVYSMQWSLGNVANLDPTQQGRDQQILYNVILKSNQNADLKLHQESDWASIPYGNGATNMFDNIRTSFVARDIYNEMCFVFDKPFPPGGASNRRTEICRPIADVQVSDAFNTGDPTFTDEVEGDPTINTGSNQNTPGRFQLEVPQ